MLTTDQKEAILRRAGVAVPDFPDGHNDESARVGAAHEAAAAQNKRQAAERRDALERWAHAIETLYVEYVARRAAKGLRDAEEARQLRALQVPGQDSKVR